MLYYAKGLKTFNRLGPNAQEGYNSLFEKFELQKIDFLKFC